MFWYRHIYLRYRSDFTPFIMATPFEKECEKYHIFRSPFVTSCVCRAPKYLFSSGACEGCLKVERRALICSFRDLVCSHPEIPDETQ